MFFLPIAGSVIAGWLVNQAADRLPVRRPDCLLDGGLAGGQHRIRTWLVWVLAWLLGWLAYLGTERWAEGLLLAGLSWFFLAVAVIDCEQRLVLNCMLLPAAPLILLGQWLAGGPQLASALLGGVAGFGCFLVLALLQPGSLGMGDVKLAGVVGLAVGITDLGLALVVAVCAGGLASLLVLIRSGFRRGQTIAYAPYLVIGAWTALYVHSDLLHLFGRVGR